MLIKVALLGLVGFSSYRQFGQYFSILVFATAKIFRRDTIERNIGAEADLVSKCDSFIQFWANNIWY